MRVGEASLRSMAGPAVAVVGVQCPTMRRRCQRNSVSARDQPPGSARSRERGRYRPEQAPVGVGELGSVDLSAQHSELVAQHDDLKVLAAA